jgi:hypothetical protein
LEKQEAVLGIVADFCGKIEIDFFGWKSIDEEESEV